MIRTEKAMTIEDIREFIASDENRTLELKKTTGELKDGMHSACAFLNTAGGLLFFGIAPTSPQSRFHSRNASSGCREEQDFRGLTD